MVDVKSLPPARFRPNGAFAECAGKDIGLGAFLLPASREYGTSNRFIDFACTCPQHRSIAIADGPACRLAVQGGKWLIGRKDLLYQLRDGSPLCWES